MGLGISKFSQIHSGLTDVSSEVAVDNPVIDGLLPIEKVEIHRKSQLANTNPFKELVFNEKRDNSAPREVACEGLYKSLNSPVLAFTETRISTKLQKGAMLTLFASNVSAL